MEVNTDMKKALRGGYTWCVPGCDSNTKRDRKLSFHKFPRDVFLREKWVNSIKRIDFIPGEQHHVCSQHFHGAKEQGRSDVPIIFPLLRESLQKIHLPLEPPASRNPQPTIIIMRIVKNHLQVSSALVNYTIRQVFKIRSLLLDLKHEM